jgi:hypothetical protein
MTTAATEATEQTQSTQQQNADGTAESTDAQGNKNSASTTQAGNTAEATAKAEEWDGKIESLPAGAQKVIADLRKADGDERMAAKTLAAIQKALNPDAKDEEKPDPVKLAAQLTNQQNETRQAKLDLAVYKAATRAGADEDLLDAVLTRKGSLAELDPSDKDFTKKLDAVVKAELDANPKLRKARAAGASGSDFSGGSGEGALTQEKFDSMTPAEKNALYKSNPAEYRKFSGR